MNKHVLRFACMNVYTYNVSYIQKKPKTLNVILSFTIQSHIMNDFLFIFSLAIDTTIGRFYSSETEHSVFMSHNHLLVYAYFFLIRTRRIEF